MQEPLPPFVVETGFQSLPSQETLRIACPDEEQTLAGPGVEKLNYHTEGMQRLARFASDYFAPPAILPNRFIRPSSFRQDMPGRLSKPCGPITPSIAESSSGRAMISVPRRDFPCWIFRAAPRRCFFTPDGSGLQY